MTTERWAAALRHAASRFGIGPEAFWRLSVREWRALTGDEVTPLGREELEALMRVFPDRCIGERWCDPHP